MARPSKYKQDLADRICDMFSYGASMKEVCENKDMPAPSTVYLWLTKHPEFSEKYARAKADGQESEMESLKDIAIKVLNDELEPQKARVAADIIKWRVTKLAPKKYGDRIQQNINHSGHVGIKDVADMTDEELQLELNSNG